MQLEWFERSTGNDLARGSSLLWLPDRRSTIPAELRRALELDLCRKGDWALCYISNLDLDMGFETLTLDRFTDIESGKTDSSAVYEFCDNLADKGQSRHALCCSIAILIGTCVV